jgi:3-oxoacyl-[acyl-carrier protein] reductase
LIDTANIRRVFKEEEIRPFAEKEIPLGNFGTPQDMANMAVFLVSDRARYITGSVVVVDGGFRRHAF